MPRMIELIRQAQVPPNVMHSAACGALSVPKTEALEILIYMTTLPVFAERAKGTLEGWDDTALLPILSDTASPREVLNYFLTPGNRRLSLMPALIANSNVSEGNLSVVSETSSRELLDLILQSERAKSSPDIMAGMAANPLITQEELDRLKEQLEALGKKMEEEGQVFDYEAALWMIEHAKEIAAEEGKALDLVDGTTEEKAEAAAAAAAQEEEKLSVLQRLARMTVGERVQRAFKGNKEERFILIRDGSKVVSNAVLESPKLTDAEVETFASMKNVQEGVLRSIAMKRKFMKNYSVIRALVNNPRTPLDVSLNLLNHVLVKDLKALSINKNVPDTLRKLALRKAKEKS